MAELENDDDDEYAVMLASPRSAPPSQQVTSPVYDLVDSDDDVDMLPLGLVTSSQRSTASVQHVVDVDESDDEYAYAYMDDNPFALAYSPPSSPIFNSDISDRQIPQYAPPSAPSPPPVAAAPPSVHLGPTESVTAVRGRPRKAKATKSPGKPRKPKPRVHVYLEESLFDSDVGEKMYTALVNHTTASKPTPFGCYVTDANTVSLVVPKSIMWRDGGTVLPMACVYLPAADFLHAIATEYASVYDHIVKLRQQVSDPYARTFLLVEGLEKALVVHQRARQRQVHVQSLDVDDGCDAGSWDATDDICRCSQCCRSSLCQLVLPHSCTRDACAIVYVDTCDSLQRRPTTARRTSCR